MEHTRINPSLHWIALGLAVATFPLIFMGGLVTSHQAGLAVPDWPNSFGYNMFLFPPNQWVGGIFYEHTHRLMGTLVGFLSVVFVIVTYGPSHNAIVRKIFGVLTAGSGISVPVLQALFRGQGKLHDARSPQALLILGLLVVFALSLIVWVSRAPDTRKLVRRLAWILLAAVLLQGSLGGLRVVKLNLDLAVIHGCFAQAYFCLAGFTVLVTSKWWESSVSLAFGAFSSRGRWAARLAVVALVVIYGQLVLGAIMRHYRAGLAIPDFPLAYGKVIPPSNDAELQKVARPSPDWDHLLTGASPEPDYVSTATAYGRWMKRWPAGNADPGETNYPASLVWLQFGHRLGAIVVTTAVICLLVAVGRLKHLRRGLALPSLLLGLLLLAQVTLGGLTVLLRKPADIASTHVAVGALVLLVTFILAAKSVKLFGLGIRLPRRSEATVEEDLPDDEATPAFGG